MIPKLSLLPLLLGLVQGSVIPSGVSIPNEDDEVPTTSQVTQTQTQAYSYPPVSSQSQGYGPSLSASHPVMASCGASGCPNQHFSSSASSSASIPLVTTCLSASGASSSHCPYEHPSSSSASIPLVTTCLSASGASSSHCPYEHHPSATSSASIPLVTTCLSSSGESPHSCPYQHPSSVEASATPCATTTSTTTEITTPTSYVTITSIITSTNSNALPSSTSASSSSSSLDGGYSGIISLSKFKASTSSGSVTSTSGEITSTTTSGSTTATTNATTTSSAGAAKGQPTAGIWVYFEDYLDITIWEDIQCQDEQWSGSKAILWMFGFYEGYFQKVFDVVKHEPPAEGEKEWGKGTETVRCTASVTASPTEIYSMTVDHTSHPTSTGGPAFMSCTSLNVAKSTGSATAKPTTSASATNSLRET